MTEAERRYRSKPERKAVVNKQLRLRRRRRKSALKRLLGSVCEKCGSRKRLEFDHRDPLQKKFTITTNINKAWDEILKEIEKCQLLCKKCHDRKSGDEKILKSKKTLSYERRQKTCDGTSH
jgi:5-methylcytosine-specific restriction endonuclease McrA